MKTSQIAPVPLERQIQGITWLGVADDSQGSGGAFLFFFVNLKGECDYDQWYETIELAKKAAYKGWGVDENAWRVPTGL